MSHKSFFVLLFISILLCSFSNKKEDVNLSEIISKPSKSFVQATELMKLKTNSPMLSGECDKYKNNRSKLIKAVKKNIIFIPNKGQIVDTDGNLRPEILYKATLNGVDLYLTKKGMSFVFYKPEDKPRNIAAGKKETRDKLHFLRDEQLKDKVVKMYRMDLNVVDMNSNFSILNEEQTEEHFNYYYAHCPKGITNVHGYRKVTYKNVYDNIDMVFHSNEKGFKYDFIVKPGGNVSDIKLRYENEDVVHITKEGKLRAINSFGEIETDVLHTYQSDGKVIESCYNKDTDGTIGIQTAEYNRTKNLIIDPYIGASYYGGNGEDVGISITTDEEDNILITGYCSSTNFPVLNPGGGAYFQDTLCGWYTSRDCYIIKLSSNGIRLWATYYGGNHPDLAYSITTDVSNNILITGATMSFDLPVYNPGGGAYFQDTIRGYQDALILKFNSTGVRLWATYYGGDDYDWGNSITTDGNNNIFITGETGSDNLPILNPGGGTYFQTFGGHYNDAFILRFDSNGIRKWATFYGANDQDFGNSITTDENDNILIAGGTESTNFPVLNPGGGAYFQDTLCGGHPDRDGFVLKFSSEGVRLWATYYGGDWKGEIYSITTDGDNNILLTGSSWCFGSFPVYNPGGGAYFQGLPAGGSDPFISKFNSNGILLWATFYGGTDTDNSRSIASDNNKNILVTGYTYNEYFPLLNPGGGAYFQGSNAGHYEIFILKFNQYGVRKWATFYGGNRSDYGYSITTAGNNNILVTGKTLSENFPVYNAGGGSYFQGTKAEDYDSFILSFNSSGSIGVNVISSIVPDNFILYQNHPNPFNPITNIKFDLKKSSHTKLIIYDMLGKEVATLVNEKLDAGSYEVKWDGSGYSSGVYFYQLKADDYVDTKKMLLIK